MVARHQCVRQHQIADAQRGRQAFRKGVHIYDPPRAVHLAQRRDGARGIAELAVVVVLDDIAVGRSGRPAQDLHAAGSGHDRAERKMVRRRQVDDRSVARRERIRAQAAFIERQRAHRHPAHIKNLVQLAVAGVFERIHAVAPEQLDDQVHQVLRTRADQNVVRRDIDAAEVIQIPRDLLTQLGRAARVGRAQQAVGVFAQHAARQPRPRCKRETLRIHDIRAEIVLAVVRRHGMRMRRRRFGRLRLCRDGQLLLHKIPAPRLGDDIAFREQLAVGGLHRDLADAQIRGQLALARQAGAARERAGHDIRAHGAVELLV